MFFIRINFLPPLHIIGRSLVRYTYLSSFIAKLGEKQHFTSSMNTNTLFVWYQTIRHQFYVWRLFLTHTTHQKPVVHLKFLKVSSSGTYKTCLKCWFSEFRNNFFQKLYICYLKNYKFLTQDMSFERDNVQPTS